jgi:hypothetical protein
MSRPLPGKFAELPKLDGKYGKLFGSPEIREYYSPPVRYGEDFFLSAATLVLTGLEMGLPLRIGLAFGDCVVQPSRQLFVGLPFVYAYETEQRQEWVGGACHNSCYFAPGFGWYPIHEDEWRTDPWSYQSSLELRHLVQHQIPVKPGTTGPSLDIALNWPSMIEFGRVSRMDRELTEKCTSSAGQEGGEKWRNTRLFYRRIRRRLSRRLSLAVTGKPLAGTELIE